MSVTFATRLLRRLGIGGRATYPNSPERSATAYGPAPTVGKLPKSDGPVQPNIKARALMIHNRNAKAASKYERIHVILSEGRK